MMTNITTNNTTNTNISDETNIDEYVWPDTSSPTWSTFLPCPALEVEDQDSCLSCKVVNDDGDFDDDDDADLMMMIMIMIMINHDDIRDRGIQTEPRPSLLRQLCLCFLSNQVHPSSLSCGNPSSLSCRKFLFCFHPLFVLLF